MKPDKTYECAEQLKTVMIPIERHNTLETELKKWKNKYQKQSKEMLGYKKLLKDLKELQ